uniref:N-(4-amino-2-hydroxybutyl) tetradecanamide synthase n=1 Tax=uncultured bacterium RM44 TaxID=672208 RepID=D3W8M6_9BACT|nr:N-(4-amino-2-hydroxybutyl) tetradecanamide synthase [uncultured bacterium RM44]
MPILESVGFMKTLWESGGAQVALMESREETSHMVGILEGIAAELSWRPGTQLRDYQDRAAHLAVLVGSEIVGGLQIVTSPSADCLPYRLVWPEVCVPDGAAIADITILALRKEYRARFNLFWPLCVELWRHCVAEGATEMRLEATPDTLRLYRRIGWPLEVIGDLRLHWNEPCFLCRMGIVDVAGAMVVRALQSATYQAVLAGMSRPVASASPVATNSGL